MEEQKRGKKLLFKSKWKREEGVSGSENFYKVCYSKIESDKKQKKKVEKFSPSPGEQDPQLKQRKVDYRIHEGEN